MKHWSVKCVCCLCGAFLSAVGAAAAEPAGEVRQIRLIQDDAQTYITSKIYKLKYVKATDIRPFVLNAVSRYDSQSKVERINYVSAGESWLLVSTAPEMIPLVDDMIAKFDRPGKTDQFGSIIEGTGITRISYTPRYRAARDIINIINSALRTDTGAAFLNEETNTLYWKDDEGCAKATLAWVQRLDRPVPQVNMKLKYYEIRESRLRDLGMDYLAWKNGPGLNLFATGFSAGRVVSDEVLLNLLGGVREFVDIARDFSTSWSYGGFYTAPAFDFSFIRLLQQSGDARLVSSADLSFINTPVYGNGDDVTRTYFVELTPEYQNIRKDSDDRTDVVGNEWEFPVLALKVTNPVICFGAGTGQVNALGDIPETQDFYRNNRTGGVIFDYHLGFSNVVERNNRGDEVGNYARVDGAATLGFGVEKLLASYIREQDVEQTIGMPFLSRIPVLKYLFGTTTTIRERSYIVVTAEAGLVHPDLLPEPPVSREIRDAELN